MILTVRGARAQVPEAGLASQGQKLFLMGYLGFAVLVIVMMARVRKRLYKRVMMSFYATMALSFGLLIVQAVFEQSSFTVASFLFPMLTMLYTLHANPYDAQLGAIDSKGLAETVRYYADRKQDFLFFSLYMHSFNEEGVVLPVDLQAAIRRFASDFFRGTMLFQVGRGHMLLASGSSERSRQIVVSLAHMFAALNYAVLYEGVESDSDERMCLDMSASYLQGYKYSRPVPISELEEYCRK